MLHVDTRSNIPYKVHWKEGIVRPGVKGKGWRQRQAEKQAYKQRRTEKV